MWTRYGAGLCCPEAHAVTTAGSEVSSFLNFSIYRRGTYQHENQNPKLAFAMRASTFEPNAFRGVRCTCRLERRRILGLHAWTLFHRGHSAENARNVRNVKNVPGDLGVSHKKGQKRVSCSLPRAVIQTHLDRFSKTTDMTASLRIL